MDGSPGGRRTEHLMVLANLGKSQLFWAKDKCIRSNYFGQSGGKVVL